MNILFYMPTVLIGGIRTVTEILTKGFQRHGHKVFWLVHSRCYNNDSDYPEGYNIVYLPDTELFTKYNVTFYNEFVERNNIDIVINQDGLYEGSKFIAQVHRPLLNFSVLHSNPLMNYEWLFKDISTLKDDSLVEKFRRLARIILYFKIKKHIYKYICSRFKFLNSHDSIIVFLSPKYKESINKLYPINNESIAIANPNTYRFPQIKDKEKIVLYVGRIDNRSKKIQYLVDIWNKLGERTVGWKLVIVGTGPDMPVVKKMAMKSANIEFVGYQDPETYYQRAAILCMTSLFEGFPMVLTEAMQHGCVPVVFNSFPAVYDIINSGKDGEIINAFDKKAYAKTLLHLMNNDDYRKMLSKNAIESVKKFDQDNILHEWESLFNRSFQQLNK